MSISLDPIVNTNTFGVWKDRTNEIVNALEDVVTIGGSEDNRVGDITIRGDITSTGNVVVDTINTNGPSTELLLNSSVKTNDELTINNGGSGEGKITFLDDGTITWKIHTSSDHDHLDIIRSEKYMRIDYSEGSITGSGLTISEELMPSTDAVVEGSSNFYFTDARARNAISVAENSSITYNSSTGVLDFTLPTIPEYGVAASSALKRTADGDNYKFAVQFDNNTIKTNTANQLYVAKSGIVGSLESGTGVSIESDGTISIGQAVGTSSDVTFAKVTATSLEISSDLTVDDDGNIAGANASFSTIAGTKLGGNWIATESEAQKGTNNDQVMTPLRVKQAIDTFAIPIWAGKTTEANVKTTYDTFPVGTRVAFLEEDTSSYSFGTGNGGSHTVYDKTKYRRVITISSKIPPSDPPVPGVLLSTWVEG